MHIKSLVAHIQRRYNKFFWINNLDPIGGGYGLISSIGFLHEYFFIKWHVYIADF